MVITRGLPFFGGQRHAGLRKQLFAGFVHAQHGVLPIVGFPIQGPVPEQLDSFVLICYDFEGVIMELFVLCKDARQWSGLLQRSSIDSGL
jgi:hypothetical protein